MLLNYLKLSLRLLARNPFFTGINVVGLAIGFASFYALWEYSIAELKSDQYHRDSERIARIGANWNWTDDGGKTWGHLTFGFAKSSVLPAAKEEFSEVEATLRLLNQENFIPALVSHDNTIVISFADQNGHQRAFKEEKIAYADSNLFNFFTIPLVYGQPEHVLSEPNYVVLSQSTATRYFGKKDPTGELLKMNGTTTLKVSGVFEDLPHYTHLNFRLVISNAALINKWNTESSSGPVISYLKLNHKNFKSFEAKINRRVNDYWATDLRRDPHVKMDMYVQALAEIPFSQSFSGDNFYPKSKPFLFTLALIALSVLVMAWVNYINLSVTRTSRRFKEIATRKVSGAKASDMISQFVTEAFVTNVLALGLAITLIQIVRAPASFLFNIQIANLSSLSFISLTIFSSIIIVGILLSGLYPAIVSMTYQPRVLFNLRFVQTSTRLIPSLLTTSQLAVAIILIMLGFTVSFQLNHILSMDTGINHNQTIIIESPVVKSDHYETLLSSFKKEISKITNVLSVTTSSFLVNRTAGPDFNVKNPGSDLHFGMDPNSVDEDFITFYDLKMLAGRTFIKDDNPESVIISRFAARRLGFKSAEEAVGAKINLEVDLSTYWREAVVIGVFENFRNQSFLNMSESSTESNVEGRGVILVSKSQSYDKNYFAHDKISVRVSPQNMEETIGLIQTKFSALFPDMVFTWYFLDQKINEVYGNEKIARNQIVLFTALALIVACLGLLAMISNKVVEKTKEIGIRKVLGAQLHQIAMVLLNATVKQTIMATIVGIPIAYYLTQLYLEKYSERISLQWWHFTIPILILVVIMFSTIASILWKAARNNPVEALKCE